MGWSSRHPGRKKCPIHYLKGEQFVETERMAAVCDLLRKGYTLRQIGTELGISKETARTDAEKMLAEYHNDIVKNATKRVGLQVARLESAVTKVFEILDREIPEEFANRDDEMKLKSIDRLVRLCEREAKLLGLDAPAKVAQTDPTGEHEYGGRTAEQLTSRLSELLERSRSSGVAGDPGRVGEEGPAEPA